jgi:hypothetical protein
MSVFNELSILAVRQVLADRAESVLSFLGDSYSDNSRRLESALTRATDRAWKSLEVALSGPSWLGAFFYTRDELELQAHVRGFLSSLSPERLPGDPATFRARCLAELRSARRVKLVPGEPHGAYEVAGAVSAFERYGDPTRVMEFEQRLLTRIGNVLREQKYPVLAQYVELRPAAGDPLLVQAARFFFMREVESDPKLSAGLSVLKMDALHHKQRDGFTRLEAALSGFRPTLDSALMRVGRIEEELARQADQLRAMAVLLAKLVQDQMVAQEAEQLDDGPETPAELAAADEGLDDFFLLEEPEEAALPPPPPAPPTKPRNPLLGRAFDAPLE